MFKQDLNKIEYLARKYDETNIPLYLSYPVSSFWKYNMTQDILGRFRTMNFDRHHFYFHFPYCKTSCYYCNCYRHVTQSQEEIDIYIEYVKREIELKRNKMGLNTLSEITRMHWGGGTPTYMNQKQIETLFGSIARYYSIASGEQASISIEAYPDEDMVTAEKLGLLKELGFNQISLGIQDFDPRVQKAINRNCSKHVAQKLIGFASDLGLDVHIDICYGLPFQGLNELERTLKDILAMSPQKIVIYPYTHYPMVFPMQRAIPSGSIPNSFIKVLLAQMAEELLVSEGYYKVGHDTYIKSSDRLFDSYTNKKIIRDFMGTSEEGGKDVIGFGSSAISFIDNVYFQNTGNIKKYFDAIDNGMLPIQENNAHILSEDDSIRSYIIRKNILCDFNINKSYINDKFDIDFDEYFKKEMIMLASLQKDGLIDNMDEHTIVLSEHGKLFARHAAHVFDTYYNK